MQPTKKEIQGMIDTAIKKAIFDLKLLPEVQRLIDKSVTKLINDKISFRSRKITDTPTDKKQVATQNSLTTYLPLTGGTLTGNVTTTGLKVGGNVGFYNTAIQAKQTATGSRGANAALASLLTALATIGLITDSTSA